MVGDLAHGWFVLAMDETSLHHGLSVTLKAGEQGVLKLIMTIAGGHLRVKSFPKGGQEERGKGGQWAEKAREGEKEEGKRRRQELKNKECFSPFQNHVGGLPERVVKTKIRTTGVTFMWRGAHGAKTQHG